MSLTVGVEVSPQDRELLTSWTRSPSIRAGLAQRARVVLLAGDGLGTIDIVRRVGLSKPAVIGWKRRYAAEGIAGLEDRSKPGRPATIDQTEIVLATLEPPPDALGVTHWSSRLLAQHLGVSDFTVTKTWKKWGLQPWRVQTFKFSTDPELEAKIRDVVGLYLNPPDKAVVLCVDEKSQVQALDRTAPVLPIRPGVPEKQTHDYVRHGTTTLFAALEVATGKVTDACFPRHRNEEFLRFLKQVAKAYPRKKLHIVVDNYATHKHPNVQAWLAKNPRVLLHFTPTSGSWLNMVEIFFGVITRQAIRRGTFTSVQDLITAIGIFVDGWNDRCEPFVWTKTADQIIPKATRGKDTSNARHLADVGPGKKPRPRSTRNRGRRPGGGDSSGTSGKAPLALTWPGRAERFQTTGNVRYPGFLSEDQALSCLLSQTSRTFLGPLAHEQAGRCLPPARDESCSATYPRRIE